MYPGKIKIRAGELVNVFVDFFFFCLVFFIDDDVSRGFCDYVLTVLSFLIFICTLPFSLCFTLKVSKSVNVDHECSGMCLLNLALYVFIILDINVIKTTFSEKYA